MNIFRIPFTCSHAAQVSQSAYHHVQFPQSVAVRMSHTGTHNLKALIAVKAQAQSRMHTAASSGLSFGEIQHSRAMSFGSCCWLGLHHPMSKCSG